MQTQKQLQDYIMPFGKFKNMRIVDIAEVYQVDKNGDDKPVGLKYLKWLCEQDWYRHKEIVQEIIKGAEKCMSEPEEVSKKKVFHTKSDPKPEPKKKPATKRINPYVLSSGDESN